MDFYKYCLVVVILVGFFENLILLSRVIKKYNLLDDLVLIIILKVMYLMILFESV